MATQEKKKKTAREERQELRSELNMLEAHLQTVTLALNALAEKVDAPEIMERVKPVLMQIAAKHLDAGLTMGVKRRA